MAVPPEVVPHQLRDDRRGRGGSGGRRAEAVGRAGVAGVVHAVVDRGDPEGPVLQQHAQQGGAAGPAVEPDHEGVLGARLGFVQPKEEVAPRGRFQAARSRPFCVCMCVGGVVVCIGFDPSMNRSIAAFRSIKTRPSTSPNNIPLLLLLLLLLVLLLRPRPQGRRRRQWPQRRRQAARSPAAALVVSVWTYASGCR